MPTSLRLALCWAPALSAITPWATGLRHCRSVNRPRRSQAYSSQPLHGFRTILNVPGTQGLLVSAALPAGVGFAMVAEPFISIVLGPAWTPAALVPQVLGTIFAAHAFSMPVTPLAMGLGCTRSLFKLDLALIFIRYPLIFAGLIMGGLLGLLFARCISGTIGIVMYVFLARRLAGVSLRAQLLAGWRAIVATLVMAGCVRGLGLIETDRPEVLQLAIMISIGGIGYCAASFVLWLASGKPAGPEREALDLLQLVRRRAF